MTQINFVLRNQLHTQYFKLLSTFEFLLELAWVGAKCKGKTLLKSVQLNKTVAQSSFLSKVLSFLLKSKKKSGKMATLFKEIRNAQLPS